MWALRRRVSEEGRLYRVLVLKSRKPGITTYCVGESFHAVWSRAGYHVMTVGSRADDIRKTHEIADRFERNLREPLRHTRTLERIRRIRFPVLDSSMWVDSARSADPGRSTTIHRVHLTEVAQWSADDFERVSVAAFNAMAPGKGEAVLESTPRGRNHWHQLWRDAGRPGSMWARVFLPWYWDPANVHPAVGSFGEPASSDERELIATAAQRYGHAITAEQLAFWRLKCEEPGGADAALQEFPWDDESCFLQGQLAVFPAAHLALNASALAVQPRDRYGIAYPEWARVYTAPKEGGVYAIGADVAEGLADGDWSTAFVLDCRTGEQVASVRCRCPEAEFAERLAWLGKLYNRALLAPEVNNHGHAVVSHLVRVLGYPNLYQREDLDARGVRSRKPGWLTSSATKPVLVTELAKALRDRGLRLADPETLAEFAAYEHKSGGGYGAPDAAGAHDDLVMAAGIAWQVRAQALAARDTGGSVKPWF